MRVRVGVVLCLFLAFLGAGCRKALVPNVDDNQAPETWITAAPQDTITVRDPQGRPAGPVTPGQIPVKYHLYWAGSDRDGAVAGYFFAVVETTAVPEPGLGLPTLPGPKPRDYRFTTKTDSTFVFSASEDLNTREHAFFVYAVDNKGKPDASPARFMFKAIDRFPPVVYFDSLNTKATGRTFSVQQTGPGSGILIPTIRDYLIRDSLNRATIPSDTVPSGSVLTFKWRGEPRARGTFVTGYRYKLDETSFNQADSSVHVASYNTGINGDVVAPGLKLFTLKALGQSGYAGTGTRRFIMNFDPDTWFAGPDKDDPVQGWQSFSDGNGKSYYCKTVPSWASFTGVPNTMFGPDSLAVLPAFRNPKKTFFEFYNDRIYWHEEGDTVHMNSWVVMPAGGLDRDSPYLVDVNPRDLPPGGPGAVLTPNDSANGSPIGFRVRVQTQTDGALFTPAETSKYPVFNVSSVFHAPFVNAYWPMTLSGKAYALIRAEDGNGATDGRIGNAREAVENPNTPPDLREKVMLFYVNRAPFLQRFNSNGTPNTAFRPAANAVYTDSSWTATSGVVNQPLNLLADDSDPYYQGVSNRPVGGGNYIGNRKVLRRSVTILALNRSGRDTSYVVLGSSNPADSLFADPLVRVNLPSYIGNGPATVRVRLCDCDRCEEFPGSGRCIIESIPITLNIPGRDVVPMPSEPTKSTQRPGSPSAVRRSY
jgi:hypothetical protein